MGQPTPSVGSFLVADQVFQQKSGKWCVIGIFNRVISVGFPTIHPSLGLFFRLSDAQGEYRVRVDLCDAQDRVITKAEGVSLVVKNRLVDADFGVQTHNLPIPAPGKYFFKLYLNEELVPGDFVIEAIKGTPGA